MPEEQKLAELAELGVLTASLLHELRQPLFALKGRLQIARAAGRSPSPSDLQELLQHVVHIEELVEHYAGLGRPDDTWTEIDLRREVERALGMLGHRIRQVSATISTDLGDEPLPIRCRSVAIRQVVLNLVGNALDAVAHRQERRIFIRTRNLPGKRVILEVTDTGGGLPPSVRDRLFEAFVTTKPSGLGTGLGLFIARKLLDEVSGVVSAEDGPGGGTRMRVELPRN
jgi:signal transduction histidine kinase